MSVGPVSGREHYRSIKQWGGVRWLRVSLEAEREVTLRDRRLDQATKDLILNELDAIAREFGLKVDGT